MTALRIAYASVISGVTTSSCMLFTAVKQTPLWSQITTPEPNWREEARIAASTYIEIVTFQRWRVVRYVILNRIGTCMVGSQTIGSYLEP
jgi:hypothetical protein